MLHVASYLCFNIMCFYFTGRFTGNTARQSAAGLNKIFFILLGGKELEPEDFVWLVGGREGDK